MSVELGESLKDIQLLTECLKHHSRVALIYSFPTLINTLKQRFISRFYYFLYDFFPFWVSQYVLLIKYFQKMFLNYLETPLDVGMQPVIVHILSHLISIHKFMSIFFRRNESLRCEDSTCQLTIALLISRNEIHVVHYALSVIFFQLSCCFITHPQMESSSATKHKHHMLKTKILSHGPVKNMAGNSHQFPTFLAE